jgi:hypothetical protein
MSLKSKLDGFKASAPFVTPRLVVNFAGSRFLEKTLAQAPAYGITIFPEPTNPGR